MGLGWQELAILLLIVVIIFGAGKFPDAIRSVGKGVKEFKQEAVGPVASGAAMASADGDSHARDAI